MYQTQLPGVKALRSITHKGMRVLEHYVIQVALLVLYILVRLESICFIKRGEKAPYIF